MTKINLELSIPGPQDELRASGFPSGYGQLLVRLSKSDLLQVLSTALEPERGVTVLVSGDFRTTRRQQSRHASTVDDIDLYYCDSLVDLEQFLGGDAERIIFIRGKEHPGLREAIARVGKPWWKFQSGAVEGAIAAYLEEGEVLFMLGSDDEGLEAVGPGDAVLKAAQSIIALQRTVAFDDPRGS